MEKKGKIKIAAEIALLALLLIAVAAALLVPHGEDTARQSQARIWEGNMAQGAGDGIYLPVEQSEVVPENCSWDFDVEKEGWYYLGAGYMVIGSDINEPEFEINVDGERLLNGEKLITLTRIWSDTGEFRHTAAGDEIRPEQNEVNLWMEEPFREATKNRVSVWLDAGKHNIALTNTNGNCLVEYLHIYQEESVSYADYLAQHSGAAMADEGFYSQIEGETPYLKSSAQLYAVYDRSSPFTLPYHSTCIRYNTIGGSNWADDGQWIEWQVDVPQDGLYQLGLRYRQNENKGQSSFRRLEIDGKVPFAEAESFEFDYDVDWQSIFLGENQTPYLFYLEKGTHVIRLEVVLREMTQVIAQMQQTLYDVNSLYREIIMITGTDPDIYRDYGLTSAIPDLDDRMVKILGEINGYINYLEERYGRGCYSSRILSQMKTQLESFHEKPYTIAKRLSVFKTNIEALAEWILEFEQQSLQIDYLYVAGAKADLPKAEGNFLSRMGHEIRAFTGSFSHSYSEVATEGGGASKETLTIWMGKGRDQANVMKRLIDAYFTPESGIEVNISLVEGALVKATLAGQGPDVNIFTTRGEAMNLAFRGAVTPLDEMSGFEELRKDYSDSAFVPYEYDGSVYGIPEVQEFYVMYVRTDILEELGTEIPQTWADLMALLPILQANSLTIGLPYTDGYATMNTGIGTINLLPTLLAQREIPVYLENNGVVTTNLMNPEAYDAFKQWSDFYVLYDFDLYKDDFNRFRTGEMPVVIAPYGLYNNLSEAAPEISGQWTMSAIPGTQREDGSINRATCASGTCSIVLKNCKNKEAAWEFTKWWSSAETQALYSREIEAELSVLGRHTPANLKAFENSYWNSAEKAFLLEQWGNVVEVPEVPGGYYVTRNVDNAFRQVYYNGENARDTLYYWMNAVDEELKRKQAQLEVRKEEP